MGNDNSSFYIYHYLLCRLSFGDAYSSYLLFGLFFAVFCLLDVVGVLWTVCGLMLLLWLIVMVFVVGLPCWCFFAFLADCLILRIRCFG